MAAPSPLRETRAAPSPAKRFAFSRSFAAQFGLAVAVAALVIGTIIIATQNLKLRDQLSQMRSQETMLQQQLTALQQQIAGRTETGKAQEQNPTALLAQEVPTISLLLAPGELRGKGSSSVLPVSSVPSTVLLLLELREDRFSSYDVALRTAEGKEIRRLEGLKSTQVPAAGPAVAVRLPSKLFQRGDYIATLSGRNQGSKSEVIDSFVFTVVR